MKMNSNEKYEMDAMRAETRHTPSETEQQSHFLVQQLTWNVKISGEIVEFERKVKRNNFDGTKNHTHTHKMSEKLHTLRYVHSEMVSSHKNPVIL